MEVFNIKNLTDLPKLDPNCCSIGAFDGIHLGHFDLINKTKEYSLKSMVITFTNLNKGINCLTSLEEKISIINNLGIDYLLIFDFHEISKIEYTEFIKILKNLNVNRLVCGSDFRFGFNRKGTLDNLKEFFDVTILDYTLYNQLRVSTSKIKEFISVGDIDLANQLLGRPYKIIGRVIKGNQIGRLLGYPTANINYSNYLLPKNGVYVVSVLYNGKKHIGMANIGFNPTVNLQEKIRFEVHIIDFNKEIYGEELEVEFVKFLRDETKYNSKEELVNSLEETVKICRNYYSVIE